MSVALSVATLIVVGAASVAAIVQLRHLRASNQLNALLEIMNQWNVPMVQEALAELIKMPEKMKDPQYVALLRNPSSIDRKTHLEFLALDLWEQIGTYCKHGLIDEAILLDITSGQVARGWNCAQAAIAILRESIGLSSMENFEYLAVRAKLWAQKYPSGTYPKRLPRMSDM
ncbi:MAG: hypothetical protein WCD38_04320 [Candidatus Tumulicola sp.]